MTLSRLETFVCVYTMLAFKKLLGSELSNIQEQTRLLPLSNVSAQCILPSWSHCVLQFHEETKIHSAEISESRSTIFDFFTWLKTNPKNITVVNLFFPILYSINSFSPSHLRSQRSICSLVPLQVNCLFLFLFPALTAPSCCINYGNENQELENCFKKYTFKQIRKNRKILAEECVQYTVINNTIYM